MYHKWQSYDVWILRYGVQQTKCFVILVHFLHFYPTNNPENEHFEKMKKTPGHIIILPMCTINDNHMTYGSWDLKCDRQNFLSFWAFFALSLSWQPEKSKFYKNEKNAWKYYHFTQLYHKWKSYNVWFLRYRTRQTQFFVILDHFLPFYPTNNQKNQNKRKMKKMAADITILQKWTKNHDQYCSWDMAHDRCNFYFSFWAIFCPFTS